MSTSYERTSSYEPEDLEDDSAHKAATTSPPSFSIRSLGRPRTFSIGRARSIMLGSLLIASAICVAHHYLLSYLDERDVEDLKLSQTWIRDIGNALAKFVQLALRFSNGVVLTQSIWLFVRGNRVTLDDLDTLFALPSLESVPSTLLRGSVLPALLLSGVIEALSLVGIFAPNALSVIPAGTPIESIVFVPYPNFDLVNLTSSSEFQTINSSGLVRYKGPSTAVQQLTQAVLSGSAVLPRELPPECHRGCSYNASFRATALKCAEIAPSSIDVYNASASDFTATVDPSIQVSNPTHFMEGGYVYNATASFGYSIDQTATASTLLLQSSPYDKPFSLELIFATNEFTLPFTPSIPIRYSLTGYSCGFYDASYATSFNYSAEGQTNIVHVVDYGMQLGPLSDPGGLNLTDIYYPADGVLSDGWADMLGELQTNYTRLAIADAFSRYFYGTLAFSTNSTDDSAPMYPSRVLNSIFAIRSVESGNATSESLNTLSFSLISTSYNDPARLLEDAFANLTASLGTEMAYSQLGLSGWPAGGAVSAIILPDDTVYNYQASRLWIVYGIALAITFLANMYGLFCMFRNDGAMQREFSSIAASVRAHELDTLLGEPGKPLTTRAGSVGLRYMAGGSQVGQRAGFRIAEEDGSGDEEKACHVQLLTTDESDARFAKALPPLPAISDDGVARSDNTNTSHAPRRRSYSL
ncbi:unnamed protein product [Peniophora sp. CBMAI 1063]|nr:unnamed protein product [Peniophora sp. CBMAI 1063]